MFLKDNYVLWNAISKIFKVRKRSTDVGMTMNVNRVIEKCIPRWRLGFSSDLQLAMLTHSAERRGHALGPNNIIAQE